MNQAKVYPQIVCTGRGEPGYMHVPGHPHHGRLVEIVAPAPREVFVLPNGAPHAAAMDDHRVVVRFIGQPVTVPGKPDPSRYGCCNRRLVRDLDDPERPELKVA
jgi:hypothetical protein